MQLMGRLFLFIDGATEPWSILENDFLKLSIVFFGTSVINI